VNTNYFKIRIGNLELRSCNSALLNACPHTTAEIVVVESDEPEYLYSIASWRSNRSGDEWSLQFCGMRPLGARVSWADFRTLVEIGQTLLEGGIFNRPEAEQ